MTEQEPDQLPDHSPGARRLLEALVRAGLNIEALTAAAALRIALDEGPRGRATTTSVETTEEPDELVSLNVMVTEAMGS